MTIDKFEFANVYRNNKNNSVVIHFSDAECVAFELFNNGRRSAKELSRHEFSLFLKKNNFKFSHREMWC
jgi:hypothetical protein